MSIKSFLHRLNQKDIHVLPRIPKHLPFILFVIFITATILIIPKIKAYDMTKGSSDIFRIQDAMLLKNNQEGWMKSGLESNLVATSILLAGTLPSEIDESTLESYKPSGAIGQLVNITGSLYYMPVSGMQYIASLKDNILGKPAYAQNGIGFTGLQPLIKLWSATRNIVYVLISFFFVILGTMIMLRVKISPQAVMNLQNTIPKIITILILVTFSYAISGFMIDLSYLLYNIFLWLMFTTLGKSMAYPTQRLWEPSLVRSLIDFFKFWGDSAHTYPALNNPSFNDTLYLFSTLVPIEAINLFGGLISAILLLLSAGIPGGIGIIILLIINIMILLIMLKFVFGLAKSYLNILFKVVLAPIEIAMGAFPGSKMNFSSWAISLFANIMVFPISLGFIIFLHIFKSIPKGALWTPVGLELLGHNLINLIVGFVGMTILPTFPTLIPQMITNSKPSPFGQALNQQMASLPIVSSGWKTVKSGIEFGNNQRIGNASNQFSDAVGSTIGDKLGFSKGGRINNFMMRKGGWGGLIKPKPASDPAERTTTVEKADYKPRSKS